MIYQWSGTQAAPPEETQIWAVSGQLFLLFVCGDAGPLKGSGWIPSIRCLYLCGYQFSLSVLTLLWWMFSYSCLHVLWEILRCEACKPRDVSGNARCPFPYWQDEGLLAVSTFRVLRGNCASHVGLGGVSFFQGHSPIGSEPHLCDVIYPWLPPKDPIFKWSSIMDWDLSAVQSTAWAAASVPTPQLCRCGVRTVVDGVPAMDVAIFQCRPLIAQAAGWLALGL